MKPLRIFWERELRRNHWELLTELLPDAWLMEPSPLPPQAVIPRLGLSQWRDLIGLRPLGRAFGIVERFGGEAAGELVASQSDEDWANTLQQALSVPDPHWVLEERPASVSQEILAGIYHFTAERVELAALVALQRDADQWLVASVP